MAAADGEAATDIAADPGAAPAPGTKGQIAARQTAGAMAESHTTKLQHTICQAQIIAHGTTSAVAKRHTKIFSRTESTSPPPPVAERQDGIREERGWSGGAPPMEPHITHHDVEGVRH